MADEQKKKRKVRRRIGQYNWRKMGQYDKQDTKQEDKQEEKQEDKQDNRQEDKQEKRTRWINEELGRILSQSVLPLEDVLSRVETAWLREEVCVSPQPSNPISSASIGLVVLVLERVITQ
ncbi:hypothetical protein NEHOM01_2536 [Nematocida homosporus]|uniref:uncharacterized protein n=1 Tax=Nematocida homosporus TaxID=1912981 RepID=UPI00221E5E9C|nr:uncharacterized protein NEHOM01_2536 [Nematocida homosporus]KAI5188142.1 hypothetical protein NEHOM01_2536 [Nematocida homosporus]